MNCDTHTVARIELDADVPIGMILDRTESDQSVENQYFADWQPALSSPPSWGRDRYYAIIEDDTINAKVIEQGKKNDNVLVTGDDEWRNYTVSLRCRLLLDTTGPTPDDENARTGRCGVVARMRAVRRYYTFCMDGFERFVLIRRHDESFDCLGEHAVPIDRAQYYDLKLRVEGTRLQCYVDGECVIDVHDTMYSNGKAGIRSNTFCRFQSAAVTMTEDDRQTSKSYRDARAASVARAKARMPQPKLWKTWPAPDGAQIITVTRPGLYNTRRDLTPTGDPVMLLDVGGDDALTLQMTSLEGESIWLSAPGCRIKRSPQVVTGDFLGNGALDVAIVATDRMMVLDGRSGEVAAECDLPPAGPYQQQRHEKTNCSKPHAMRFAPAPAPLGIILREDTPAGGNSMWAYDGSLNPLWDIHLPQPKFGHQPWFYDIDDDGCDELLLGYHLIDHDGKVIWLMEDAEYADRMYGARHADNVFLGPIHGDGVDRITALHAGGSDGLFFADGRTGKVLSRHIIGHAQHVEVGRYRPDLPGEQVCVGTRWGNFGIMTFFDNEGRELYQFQPDYEGENFNTVRWGGDGRDLIFMRRTPQSLGFWDAWGRRVVELPNIIPLGRPGLSYATAADVCGDEQDELLVIHGGKMHIFTQG